MSKQEHPYAQVLRWIADGETVEFRRIHDDAWTLERPNAVLDLVCTPTIASDYVYRLKPRTININGHAVAEPMRVAPEVGSIYWFVVLAVGSFAADTCWSGTNDDFARLKQGRCHATREAAEAHARALLSFTTQEAA